LENSGRKACHFKVKEAAGSIRQVKQYGATTPYPGAVWSAPCSSPELPSSTKYTISWSCTIPATTVPELELAATSSETAADFTSTKLCAAKPTLCCEPWCLWPSVSVFGTDEFRLGSPDRLLV